MNKLLNSKIYKDIIKDKLECYFISPHLDDAIFSAGGLIYELAQQKVPVTVINVFTKASGNPYTISVKKFLYSCGYSDADKFYNDRIIEDRNAITMAKARVVNLGFIDALWRRKGLTGFRKKISLLLPELDYVYPIYRLSIAKGRISRFDDKMILEIKNKLRNIITKNSPIFCPLGIGKHVDHLIVRNVCKSLDQNIVYWTDYPYVKNKPVEKSYLKINKLKKYKLDINQIIKNKLVNTYKSQVMAIFGTATEKVTKNEYYYT